MVPRLDRWVETLREHAEDSLTTDYTPRQTAASFALAIFLAVLPTFGLAPVIAIVVAAWADRINQYAMLIAFAIFNPFVLSGVLTLSFVIGNTLNTLFPILPSLHYTIPVSEQLFLFTRDIIVGNLILASILSTLGYVLGYRFVRDYQTAHTQPWDLPQNQ